VLGLDPPAVRDFLARCRPRRRPVLSRPRTRADLIRLEGNERRRRRRQAARSAPAAPRSTWDRRPCVHDAELDLVAAPIAAETPALPELVGTEARDPAPPAEPAPLKNPWVGSASWSAQGESHGAARLTWESVREIRRLRGEGMSTGSLGRKFSVARNTICAILTDKTWRDCQAPPSPSPESVRTAK